MQQVATLLRRDLGSRDGDEVVGGRVVSPVVNRKNMDDDRVSQMRVCSAMRFKRRSVPSILRLFFAECSPRAADGQNSFGREEEDCRRKRKRRGQRERGACAVAQFDADQPA
jgi:hypothetical protein